MRLLTFLLIFMCEAVISQNLVPNSSFENTSGELPCKWVTNRSQFDNAMDYWFTPLLTTPDIHSLSVDSLCWSFAYPNVNDQGGYECVFGEQIPHSGINMAGISVSNHPSGNNWKEYVEVQLDSPLITGENYYVEFFISLAESSQFTTNSIGIYFSDTLISGIDSSLAFVPQVKTNGFVNNDSTWVRVSDVITAESNWEYLTLGSFGHRDSTSFGQHTGCRTSAHYFLDDLLVESTDLSNQQELYIDNALELYPNPSNGNLIIKHSGMRNEVFRIVDILGREILKGSLNNGENFINLSSRKPGIYICQSSKGNIKFYIE